MLNNKKIGKIGKNLFSHEMNKGGKYEKSCINYTNNNVII